MLRRAATGARIGRQATSRGRLLPLLALFALLAACKDSATPRAGITIDPQSLTIAAGAVPQRFRASVTGGQGEVRWALSGPGSISQNAGPETLYTPPASVPGELEATLVATLAAGDATASASITVTPISVSKGNLSVYIEGLQQTGTGGALTVTGPGGYRETLSASKTLLDLEPGTYVLEAEDVRDVENGLESIYEPDLDCDVQPMALGEAPAAKPVTCTATVTAGETSRTRATYRPDPSTARLYVPAYFLGAVGAYAADQLRNGGADPPEALLEGATAAQGIAFDSAGNLWVTDWDANVLRMYSAAQLVASGTPEPETTITGNGGLQNPTALAFDAGGSLWVSNRGNATIVKYSPEQLSASGSPVPAVVISDDGSGDLDGPNGLAFDEMGRLWVASLFSNTLLAYADPGAFSGAVSPSASVALRSTPGGSLAAPSGLAFDASGRLWVSNQAAGTLVAFAPEQLAAAGSPAPAIAITPPSGSISGPGGLAFDAADNLWVATSGGTIAKFDASQLAASGSPSPSVVLGWPGSIDQGFLAFNPPPSRLPFPGR